MSIPKNITDVLNRLSERTKERKIVWTITSRNTEYMYQFKAGNVTTDLWIDERTSIKRVDFAINNEDGEQVDRVSYKDTDPEFSELKHFYEVVKKSFLKADETYDSLFNELDNL